MKKRSILFYGEMVRAILENRKCQTRRIIKDGCAGRIQLNDPSMHFPDCPYGQPGDQLWVKETFQAWTGGGECGEYDEARGPLDFSSNTYAFEYRATSDSCPDKWRPSIFMPSAASRITLSITNLRLQRLQDISEEDAKAEGVQEPLYADETLYHKAGGHPASPPATYKAGFRVLWNSINLKPKPQYGLLPCSGKKEIGGYVSYPWSAEDFDAKYPGVRAAGIYRGLPIMVTPSPWVWVMDFKRINSEVAK